MSARELLDMGSESIKEALDEEPQTKAHLHRTIGLAYFNLGDYELGIQHLRESLALHRIHSTPSIKAEAMNRLANNLRRIDEYDEAVTLYKEAIALHESSSEGATIDLGDAYNNFGLLIYSLAQYDEAEFYLNKAIQTHRAAAGGEAFLVGSNMHNLSLVLRVKGKYKEAESMIKSSLKIKEKFKGNETSTWAISLQQLGRIQNDLGRFNEALDTLNTAVEKHRVHYEEGNTRMGTVWSRIANSHHALGEYELAEQFYQKTLKIFSDSNGVDSSLFVYTETQYGSFLRQRGLLSHAEQALRHSLKVNQDLYIPTHPNTALAGAELAAVLVEIGQIPEATALIDTAISGFKQHFKDDHPELAWARLIKSKILRESYQLIEAQDWFDQAFVVIEKNQEQNPVHYAEAQFEQAQMAANQGQCDSHRTHLTAAIKTLHLINPNHDLASSWQKTTQCE